MNMNEHFQKMLLNMEISTPITVPRLELALGLKPGTFGSFDDLNLDDKTILCHMIKMFTMFPWLIDVVDMGFDPKATKLIMQREAINNQLKEMQK